MPKSSPPGSSWEAGASNSGQRPPSQIEPDEGTPSEGSPNKEDTHSPRQINVISWDQQEPGYRPSLTEAIAFFQQQGEDFTEAEIKYAWNLFEAGIQNGKWMWTKNCPCENWPAALRARMLDQYNVKGTRERGTKQRNRPSIFNLNTKKKALEDLVQDHQANPESVRFDPDHTKDQRKDLKRLRDKIEDLTRRIGESNID